MISTPLVRSIVPVRVRVASTLSPAIISFVLLALAITVAPRQASALGTQCTDPYNQVQDGAPAATDPTNQFSIERVNMGEPRNIPTPSAPNSTPVPILSCNGKRITAVLKVGTMDPGSTGQATQPPASIYMVRMTIPGSANSTGIEQNIFMSYDNTIIPSGAADFGWQDSPGHDCNQCAGNVPPSCENIATLAPDGTITMSLDLTATVTFGTCATTGGTNMTISPGQWAQGTQLTNIQGVTKQRIGGLLTGASVAKATTAGDGEYTVQGNVSCSNPPIAALAADVTSGNAPLTVNFNASASNMPAGSCGTIASYIFDFGDGNQVTQATATVSHTYTVGGATYPARVRVVSTKGITSSNIAQVDITVNTAGPPIVTSIASRKTHGSTDFDITLPQPPAARAIECRSGGATNDYKLVFNFLNTVTSVGGASVTSGTGSVSSRTLGPLSNQYTVNLTGVTSGQSTTVTLTNALDSSGALGPETAIIGVLVGDVNNNGAVTSSDVSSVKAQVGASLTTSNFREDVNANGAVTSSDVSATKAQVGTTLP